MNKLSIILLSLLLCSCSGTIKTIRNSNQPIPENYKRAYIISNEDSQYIKFKFGVITPFGYLIPSDNPSEKSKIIGNTDSVIKRELEKYGINSVIGKKGDIPNNFDLIIVYQDIWRWDFKKILDKLEIIFISPIDNKEISRSTYNIYKNKELHDSPSPEKEVPKMIKELLNK